MGSYCPGITSTGTEAFYEEQEKTCSFKTTITLQLILKSYETFRAPSIYIYQKQTHHQLKQQLIKQTNGFHTASLRLLCEVLGL